MAFDPDFLDRIRSIDVKPYLQKAKNGNYYCPYCGKPDAGYNKEKHFAHCFNIDCQKKIDALDMIQYSEHLSFSDAVKKLAKDAGIDVKYTDAEPQKAATRPPIEKKVADPLEQPEADYRAYYVECMQRITEPAAQAYLKQRGISAETAARYHIGFDPQADPANAPGGNGNLWHPVPRLIVPVTYGCYVARRTDGGEEYKKMYPKGTKPGIWNRKALYSDSEVVFVTEGFADALSIIEVGGNAVALNSASNAGKLLERLEAKPTKATIAICLDNDKAGQTAAQLLREGLQRLNISFLKAEINGKNKDPNEALVADREAFTAAVNSVIDGVKRPDNAKSYINDYMFRDIEEFKAAGNIRTGFKTLDEITGGLFSGLYIIAAISSLGKTTAAHQMADQLAAAGHDVIFFSMEQSRLELVSKSLARLTFQLDSRTAVDSLSIRRGYLPDSVLTAHDEYIKRIGNRLSIVEGNFRCDIDFIGRYIRRYIQKTGTKPIIFIDYLQILQPSADDIAKGQRREAIDNAVTALKRISRELGITIFAISSVNRNNYLTPIDFESLKESGGIEYTADVVWGLQLQCLHEDLFDKDKAIKEKRERIGKAKDETPRKIELVCLKNRYGRAKFSMNFDYYAQYDVFADRGERKESTAGSSGKSFHGTIV